MVCGLAGVCLAAPAQAGFAATPDPVVDDGGGITPAGVSPPDTQQAKDKVAATVLWAKAAAGGDVAGARRAEAAYESKYGGPGGGSSKASSTVVSRVMTSTDLAAAFPTSRSLGVVQVGQLKTYYCGPASGYEIIRYLHGAGFSSRFDGTAAGQGGLANANHMETDKYAKTDWARADWTLGVNRWRGVNWYVQVHAPSSSLLKSVAAQSIGGNGMPFSGDTVEFAGGPHYNGHRKDRTIGHWIAGYAYTGSGSTISWADSSTTSFPDAARYFSYSASSFATFLQSNGIAY
ncbi:hypothetical protein [Pedococcus sp. P5_B7]